MTEEPKKGSLPDFPSCSGCKHHIYPTNPSVGFSCMLKFCRPRNEWKLEHERRLLSLIEWVEENCKVSMNHLNASAQWKEKKKSLEPTK